jgi:hypothetical protein
MAQNRRKLVRFLGRGSAACLTGLIIISAVASAASVSSCAADFSSCNVYEGQFLTLPGDGIAGDVIVKDPVGGATVDVFRIFNNLVDTGGGTGLGTSAFLYGADINDLPNPSTYSVNAVSILRAGFGPTGFYETDYNGNGTIYRIFTPSPEPSTFALLGVGVLLGGGLLRKPRVKGR